MLLRAGADEAGDRIAIEVLDEHDWPRGNACFDGGVASDRRVCLGGGGAPAGRSHPVGYCLSNTTTLWYG